MPKVFFTDKQGLVQKGGTGVEFQTTDKVNLSGSLYVSGTVYHAPGKGSVSNVSGITATRTLSQGGVYSVSSSAALTTTVPDCSDVPGAMFTFRAASDHAHVVTGSGNDGFGVFIAPVTGTLTSNGTTGVQQVGSQLTLGGKVGASVTFYSDGARYLILGGSGSNGLSGT